jgi:hypothetical protein
VHLPPLLPTALWLVVAVTATAPSAIAQQGPIQLFPRTEPRAPPEPWVAPAPVAPVQPLSPEAPDDFVVEGLAPPEADAIGLTGPDGGFDRTFWRGSNPAAIAALLSDLPVVTRIPALRRLTRKLLVTGSPVAGEGASGQMLASRMSRLLAMGDLDAARRLADQLPATATDSELTRDAAEIALLQGDADSACRLSDAVALTTTAAYWSKVGVYCRLATADRDGARLGLDLMRDAGQDTDAAFFELATALADQTVAPPLHGLLAPEPIHVALLALANWPLPSEALAEASPPVLAAAVRRPALAGTQLLPVAERAFLVGAAAADQVAAVYVEEADDGAGADPKIADAWDAEARAAVYLAVREETDPSRRADLLDTTWQAAAGAERFLIGKVFAQPLTTLPVDRDLAGEAPSIARALLAADLPEWAARWRSLLEAEASQDTRSARAVRGLAPLFVLANPEGRASVPGIDAAIEVLLPAAMVDHGPTVRLFALLDGIGVPIDIDPLATHRESQASVEANALLWDLERAAADGRVGDTVLVALHLLDGRPEAADPETLTACLRALRQVGLDRDARAIAVATALIDGF